MNIKNEEYLELMIDDAKKTFAYPLNKIAYKAFLDFRIEYFKKPVTKAGATRQRKILRAYEPEMQHEIVAKSIDSKWESLFKPSQNEYGVMQRKINARKQKELKENHTIITDNGTMVKDEPMSVLEMMDLFEGEQS